MNTNYHLGTGLDGFVIISPPVITKNRGLRPDQVNGPFELVDFYGTLTCPQTLLGISVGHEKTSATADLSPLPKMRRATKIYDEHAGPADRTDISHVRM